MEAASADVRLSTPRIAIRARSYAVRSAKAVPERRKGVRHPSTITTSRAFAEWVVIVIESVWRIRINQRAVRTPGGQRRRTKYGITEGPERMRQLTSTLHQRDAARRRPRLHHREAAKSR